MTDSCFIDDTIIKPPLDPLHLDRPGVRKRRPKGRRPRKGLWDTLLDGFYPRIHDRSIPAGECSGHDAPTPSRKLPQAHTQATASPFPGYGLICYLLNIRDAGTLERHPLRGAVFESFVVSELVKSFAAQRRDPPLSFWRDASGHEIDILIDTGKRIIPVEVKSGQTIAGDAVDPLAWWTSIPSNPNHSGILVHGGTETFDFKGFRVLPWFLE